MAKHTLELDDLELTALITHLEGQSEMMVESRLNCSNFITLWANYDFTIFPCPSVFVNFACWHNT